MAIFAKIMASIATLISITLGAVLIIGVVFVLIFLLLGTVFSDNQTEYVSYAVDEKLSYEAMITEKFNSYPNKEGFALDDPQIIYMGRPDVDNVKEVISMSCVYLQQDLENEGFSKKYIKSLWDDSHKLKEEHETVYCGGCKTRSETTTNSDGSKTVTSEDYCPGHDKVTLYVYTYAFEPVEGKTIFDVDTTPIGPTPESQMSGEYDPQNSWQGWTEENQEWAKNIFENNDWPSAGIVDESTLSSASSLILELQNKDIHYVGGDFSWPAPGNNTITSKYGYRTHPITGVYSLHTGIDIGTPPNSPIVAANSGTVIYADWLGSYGKCIIIDHGGGITTLYAHNEMLAASVGDHVSKNEVVSYSGSTGRSTGPHLHFEIRKNGVSINPEAPLI